MENETIVLGGGCFWCTEAVFMMLKGISSVQPGYAGGGEGAPTPTYDDVARGMTKYVEVIKIEFNPDLISYAELLQVFFETHDPTTNNRQGNDVGPQYRSVIFYTTERQKERGEHYIQAIATKYSKPIVTTVEPLDTFYLAEDYHQKYYEYHKDAMYCQIIIDPKVEKVQEKFKDLLKK